LLADGLTTVEITFRSPAAADAIRRVSAIDGLTVGAGTVLDEEQLAAAAEAGASFAVAPSTNPVVIDAARHAGIPFVPGAATPTEIERARSLGCDVIKIFPAAVLGGPAFIRAVSAVFPDVKFIPTGGITAETAADYLALPSVLACGGTWLT
jgi:2-dehydro-3-deoxyphosphogluconate aldolase/(4S)-4-hydroxy-2-oxoglutarate aldolase